MNYINKKITNLEEIANSNCENYEKAQPFPHIILENIFEEKILNLILDDFKNIESKGNYFNNKTEKKIAISDPFKLSKTTNNFLNFLNSFQFIKFLQKLTNIKETLIPDPYLIGGGLHELKNNGFLNIHADFNQHPLMKLDRRLNILIYLNHNWKEENGGSLELWDLKMEKCVKKIIPTFNKMVVFSTTDYSYHGNPEVIKTTPNNSRKSIALYYYSNGRPEEERKLGFHSTIFKKRSGSKDPDGSLEYKKIIGKLYIKTKKKI